ncbi:MAG: DUF2062 domain-containing protein [Nitrospirae bacterium]|nr:DUF2062 domain-containing protein [Nitrospirota bacterium]
MKLRDKLRGLLSIKDSPHKVAMSFAVGVFFGISPLIGLHTILALISAWLFRLNRLATIVGVYITNPWSIIPIYTFCTWVGALLIGTDRVIPNIDWSHITLSSLVSELKFLLLPFVIGTIVVGVVSSVLSYFIIKKAIEKNRGKQV